jgi:hypothetical protein
MLTILRYRNNPTGVSYASLYNSISGAFYNYLAGLKNKQRLLSDLRKPNLRTR